MSPHLKSCRLVALETFRAMKSRLRLRLTEGVWFVGELFTVLKLYQQIFSRKTDVANTVYFWSVVEWGKTDRDDI